MQQRCPYHAGSFNSLNRSRQLMFATFSIKVGKKISQLSRLFLPRLFLPLRYKNCYFICICLVNFLYWLRSAGVRGHSPFMIQKVAVIKCRKNQNVVGVLSREKLDVGKNLLKILISEQMLKQIEIWQMQYGISH